MKGVQTGPSAYAREEGETCAPVVTVRESQDHGLRLYSQQTLLTSGMSVNDDAVRRVVYVSLAPNDKAI